MGCTGSAAKALRGSNRCCKDVVRTEEVVEEAGALQQTLGGAQIGCEGVTDALHVEALRAARSHVSDAGRLQRPRIRFPKVAHDVAVPMRFLRSP